MSVSKTDPGVAFGPKQLAELWNARCGPMHSKVRIKAGDTRWRQALVRIADEPDPAYWEEVVRRYVAWPHGRGETPGKNGAPPWVATFKFLLKPDTHTRAMEGEFERRTSGMPPGHRNLAPPKHTVNRVESIEELEKLVR